MTTLTIRIPDEEKNKFAKLAEDSDLSMSQILRTFIRELIKENEKYGNNPRIEF